MTTRIEGDPDVALAALQRNETEVLHMVLAALNPEVGNAASGLNETAVLRNLLAALCCETETKQRFDRILDEASVAFPHYASVARDDDDEVWALLEKVRSDIEERVRKAR